eukprot:17590-Chlamydomonas_euryale.AAC.9
MGCGRACSSQGALRLPCGALHASTQLRQRHCNAGPRFPCSKCKRGLNNPKMLLLSIFADPHAILFSFCRVIECIARSALQQAES